MTKIFFAVAIDRQSIVRCCLLGNIGSFSAKQRATSKKKTALRGLRVAFEPDH
jgi:hypothetical protein